MIDNSLVFSAEQAVTTTAASTNVVRTKGGDVPNRLFLVVRVDTAFAGCTSVTPSVETDDASAFSSAATVATFPTYPVASLTAGMLGIIPLPLGLKDYLRMKYTVVGTATAGKISAFITDNPNIGLD